MAVGTVLGAGFGIASVWVPWLGIAGIVVVVAAGAMALWYAWREILVARAEHNAETQAVAVAHTAHMRQVRSDHSAVMDVLSARNAKLRVDVSVARAESGELRAQVSRLRGDNESLRLTNSTLQAQLDAAVVIEDERAEVVVLPRRRALGETVEEWQAEEAETIIDLDLARLATPFVEDVVRRHAN